MSRVRMDILPAGFGVSPKRSFERTGRAGTGDAGARNAMDAQLVGGAHAPLACIVWRLAERTQVRWRHRGPLVRATVSAARRRK